MNESFQQNSTPMNCAVFIATSLDGFIARKNGDLDWLDKASEQVSEDEDTGYYKFLDTIDAIIMGSNTFSKVLSFGIDWPYEKEVIVLSKSMNSVPSTLPNTVSLSSESPAELCIRLEANGYKRLYVDGGSLIQSFLQKKLIDEITITTIPVLLGSGIPLFRDFTADIHLQLKDSKAYNFGFVQTTYRVVY